MLDSLRKRVDHLIVMAITQEDIDKYNLIKNVLAYDNCFLEMDASTAMSLIMDLNYKEDKARDIYLRLLEEGYGWNIQAS